MLEQVNIEILYAIGGLLAGLFMATLYFFGRVTKLERQNAELTAQIKSQAASFEAINAEMNNRFKLSAQEALRASSEQFLQLAQEKLKIAQNDGAHDLEKRQKAIETLVKPIQEQLDGLGKAVQQTKGTDEELRKELKFLTTETAKLVGALRDPSAQGQWGEYILEGLLEKSGLMKGIHYETQVSFETENGRVRPDAVINMQDGFNIIIDAKAPINEFTQRLGSDLNEDQYNEVMRGIARQVKSHVQALGKKGYWENLESPDFTVLFLPSEHIYSLALRADPTLVDYATAQNIIIASPTLLMSLLRVVGMSWRQVELAKNAQEISELGGELYKRLLKFTDHIGKVGKNLQNAMNGYDSAIGSLEKSVLPSARKMHELQGKQSDDLQKLDAIERNPRLVSLTEEDEAEKKRA
ncbi:MAG: DNA recombination protein RmuC [Alphaproteobacteria bacterium]